MFYRDFSMFVIVIGRERGWVGFAAWICVRVVTSTLTSVDASPSLWLLLLLLQQEPSSG